MPTLEELISGAPEPRNLSAADVRNAIAAAGLDQTLVVLDDDPTGTQSIAGLPILTKWEEEDFRWAFEQKVPAVYVMTNSRSLDPETTETLTREVVTTAAKVAREMGVDAGFVTRGDSTLRGHFPLEPNVIADASGQNIDGIILIPAFDEAGRVTVGGVHYARIAGNYTPVGETEFAKDATFDYRSSALAEWVEEKTEGAVTADQVAHIPLDVLRTDPEKVLEIVLSLTNRQVLTCDIVNEQDMRALSIALAEAEGKGRKFVYRVGPPFVRARIGQDKHAPLTRVEVEAARVAAGGADMEYQPGGLAVVGSHVGVTQRQLQHLKDNVPSEVLEIDVLQVLDEDKRQEHLDGLIARAVELLKDQSVIVQTSRTLIKGADGDASLEIARKVSTAVVTVVHGIVERVRPAYVLAKGGITSSDVASRGLEIRRGIAVGPMLPGIVSLWMAQDGLPKAIPYIVFPGNVGDDTSLTAVVQKLRGM